jgi:hypothetical protein
MIAAVTLAAAALSAGSGTAPARLALTVSPAHVALDAGGKATVHVGATRGARLLLRASVAGLALDARGRPQIIRRRDAGRWLKLSRRTISVGRAGATFVVASRRPLGARPGDHCAIVLLTATAPAKKGVVVQMRVGLVVTVRVAGRRVRRLEVVAARARRLPGGRARLISVTVVNRGDAIESLGGPQLEVTLLRRGRAIARLRGLRRKVLPHSRAVVTFRCRAAVPGDVVARIAVATPDGGSATRRFRLRL